MRKIWGFYVLNLKMIFEEKIPLIWTILVPLIIAISGKGSYLSDISSVHDKVNYLIWFWSFIILSCFINGIGLQLLRLREHNLLKTYTLLAGSKHYLLVGVILEQITLCAFSLLVFTTVMSFYIKITTLSIILIPLIGLVFLSIPLSLLAMIIPNLPARYSSLSIIINISMYPLLLLAIKRENNPELKYLYSLNPFETMHDIFSSITSWFVVDFPNKLNVWMFISAILYLFIGGWSYSRINLLSRVQR